MSLGLILGRQRQVRRVVAAAATVAITLPFIAAGIAMRPGDASAQTPPPGTPEVIEVTATVDPLPLAQALGATQLAEAMGSAASSGTAAPSDLRFTIVPGTGSVTGQGVAVLDGFPMGVLFHFFAGFGEAIGGAITGDDTPATVAPLPPALASCTSQFSATLALTGTFDAATGAMEGTADSGLALGALSGCPPEYGSSAGGEFSRATGTWDATLTESSLRGEIRLASEPPITLPFEASLEPEDEPVATPPPAAAGGTAPAGDEPGDGDPARGDRLLPPPVDIDEIGPGEAAATGLAGAGAAGIVAVISVASAAAGAATGAPVDPFSGERKRAGEDSPKRRPPDRIDPEEAATAAANIAKTAETGGYEDILTNVRKRIEAGALDPAALEALREMLKKRIGIDAAIASSDLTTRSDWEAFRDGYAEDLNKLYPGLGTAFKHPVLVARIAIGMATGGGSEAVFFPADVVMAVYEAANTPGSSVSDAGALGEMATVVAWEGAKEVAVDLGVGLIGKGMAGAGAAASGAKGVDFPGSGAVDEADGGLAPKLPDSRVEMPNSPVARGGDVPAPAQAPAAAGPARAGAADFPQTRFDPDFQLGPKPEVPKADDTWLREAPNGTRLPDDQIPATGYTREQVDAMQEIAGRNDVLIGSRATNPASAHHIANGTAVPKPVDVKAKTANPLDAFIGGDPKNEGLVTVFQPRPPDARQFSNIGDYNAAVNRFAERQKEFEAVMKDLPNLNKKGISWDPQTGLLRNADGKPYAGDIDLVYVKDAKTGDVLMSTDPRYQAVMRETGASPVATQHNAETSVVVDIQRKGGDAALPGAWRTQTSLSQAHERGREIVLETSGAGIQKGPTPFGVFDRLNPGQSSLGRGLPVELPE